MSEFDTVPYDKKVEIFNKTNGICILCGKKLSNSRKSWTVEHFIPRAVHKWVPDTKIRLKIESDSNLYIVHRNCNYLKNSTLPTEKDIDMLYAAKDIKNQIRQLYKSLLSGMNDYNALKQRVLIKQNNCCSICGERLFVDNAVIRRIDTESKRCFKNAMCLCGNCNSKLGFRKKNKEKLMNNI